MSSIETVAIPPLWFPYIHILNNNNEVRSTSATSYTTVSGRQMFTDISKTLVFSYSGRLLATLDRGLASSRVENLAPKKRLPNLFDGGVFDDAKEEVEYDTIEFFRKIKRIANLRNTFKRTTVSPVGYKTDRDRRSQSSLMSVSHLVPLLAREARLHDQLSSISTKLETEYRPYGYELLGLWPENAPKPIPIPEVSETNSLAQTILTRKNINQRRFRESLSSYTGTRLLAINAFRRKLSPGVFQNNKVSTLLGVESDTVRFLPNVEKRLGYGVVPNLEDYYITP